MRAQLLATVSRWIEDPNPILLKELRATFRTPLFARFLYGSVAMVGLLVLASGALAGGGDPPPARVGQILFQLYFSTTLFVICMFAPGYAATTITGEREQRTWESLQLSGMGASRIVVGKFLASYASIALVIVALSPISGVAFLFGGVAPTQVVVGLLSMLVALAPAIAFGIAVSARLRSTRLSIVLTTLIFVPCAMVGTFVMAAFGEVAERSWHLTMQGPFFYTDAFTTRLFEWDTWVVLLGGTLYAVGMSVWLLLASAIAGVRPAAENRVAPLKRWAIVMSVATVIVVVALLASTTGARGQGKTGMWLLMGVGALTGFFAIMFANEPAVPPRSWELAQAGAPAWRRVLGVFGPGAAGTLRFSAALIVGTSALACFAVIALRHALNPSWGQHVSYDLASAVIAIGLAAVSLFAAAFGTWLRVMIRNGLASRLATLAVIAMCIVGPFFFALIVEPHSMNHLGRRAPLLVHASAIYPLLLGAQVNDLTAAAALQHASRLIVTLGIYGLLGAACWAGVEALTRKESRAMASRRAWFEPGGQWAPPAIARAEPQPRASPVQPPPTTSDAEPPAPPPDESPPNEPPSE